MQKKNRRHPQIATTAHVSKTSNLPDKSSLAATAKPPAIMGCSAAAAAVPSRVQHKQLIIAGHVFDKAHVFSSYIILKVI